MQAGALTWCTDVAGRRPHRSLDGASPLSVFEAVEAPTLITLPHTTFELATLVASQGRTGLLHQGGQGAVLGALALHRPPGRRPRWANAPSRSSPTAS